MWNETSCYIATEQFIFITFIIILCGEGTQVGKITLYIEKCPIVDYIL